MEDLDALGYLKKTLIALWFECDGRFGGVGIFLKTLLALPVSGELRARRFERQRKYVNPLNSRRVS